MQNARMLSVEINETAKAFRINGVTFAKKYLCELFPSWGASDESFHRFLVIMPFFAETKEIGDAPTVCGNYTIAKSKRIQEAVGIYGDIIPAFMMMAAQIGNINEGNVQQIADQCHDVICSCGVKKSPRNFGADNVVDLRKYQGKTLH